MESTSANRCTIVQIDPDRSLYDFSTGFVRFVEITDYARLSNLRSYCFAKLCRIQINVLLIFYEFIIFFLFIFVLRFSPFENLLFLHRIPYTI